MFQKESWEFIDEVSSTDWANSICNPIKKEDSFYLSNKKSKIWAVQDIWIFKVDGEKHDRGKEVNTIY